jgi:hypothetical protein
VGLILDLAVVALAALVIGSLALLTWTLTVSAVRSVRRGRAQVAASRRSVAEVEARLRTAAGGAVASLSALAARTTPARPTEPGDGSDA